MKENSDPDVCPCCGQNMPKLYFFEQWSKEYLKQLEKASHVWYDRFGKKFQYRKFFLDATPMAIQDIYNGMTISVDRKTKIDKIPKPLFLLAWEKQNPMPGIKHIGFTALLAQRVEHLESLLREKGVEV